MIHIIAAPMMCVRYLLMFVKLIKTSYFKAPFPKGAGAKRLRVDNFSLY